MSESLEVQALRQYMIDSGVPHRVSATLGRYISAEDPCAPHTARSAHCGAGTGGKGLAVDFAAPGVGVIAGMQDIYEALAEVAPHLSELIYNDPHVHNRAVKRGLWCDGVATYGAVTWAAHANHVHVAVDKGTFLAWPKQAAAQTAPLPEENPMAEPLDACPAPNGGVWVLTKDGGVRAYKGAPFYGGYLNLKLENRRGNPTFTGLEAAGDGYRVVTADPNDADYTFNADVWAAIERGEV